MFLLERAKLIFKKSRMVRKGPQNPGRGRQPKRLNGIRRLFPMKLVAPLKGPDKGTG